ncbi:MAG: DUF6266 family protein [Bacteroidota bacterium]
MAIANNGPQGEHRGKVGNIVYYKLKGQNVARKTGRRTKPPTTLQLRHWAVMKLVPPFLKGLLDFINVGFSAEMVGTTKNAYNLAVEYNIKEIVKGEYPDLELDYTKVTVSKGILKPASNPVLSVVPEGIAYSWDTDPRMAWPESSDQVMMLAWFPGSQVACYTLFGNDRLLGSDILPIPEDLREEYMETYVSFISANRKQLSDSIYTGSFNEEG